MSELRRDWSSMLRRKTRVAAELWRVVGDINDRLARLGHQECLFVDGIRTTKLEIRQS